ncbi:hypothetical protein MNEG_16112, partial [Monoraphidium neglectum]
MTCRAAQVGADVDEQRGELHLLQAADRLLLISEAQPLSRPLWQPSGPAAFRASMAGADEPGGSGAGGAGGGGAANDLSAFHVPLPAGYVAAGWPLVHAAASASGADVAVSGRRGLAVYGRHAERWRLFGDVTQERRVSCVALGWLGGNVVACSAPSIDPVIAATSQWALARAAPPGHRGGGGGGGGGTPNGNGGAAAAGGGGGGAGGVAHGKGEAAGCQILVFPKRHLDFGSLVASYDLKR